MAYWVSVIVKLCKVPEEADMHKKRSHEKVSMREVTRRCPWGKQLREAEATIPYS